MGVKKCKGLIFRLYVNAYVDSRGRSMDLTDAIQEYCDNCEFKKAFSGKEPGECAVVEKKTLYHQAKAYNNLGIELEATREKVVALQQKNATLDTEPEVENG